MAGLANCVYCGIASPRYTLASRLYSASRWWITYTCKSCDHVAFTETVETPDSRSSQGIPVRVILPQPTAVAPELPERAKLYLEQAISSIGAPDGSVMLCGSAVDAMLKGRGLKEGSVYSRIKEAVDNGLLTSEMADWAHAVRLGSNNPRHADDETPHMTVEDARRLIDFAQMLGHILFTLPMRVAEGKAKAQKGA